MKNANHILLFVLLCQVALICGCDKGASSDKDSSGKEEELILPGSVGGAAGLAEALSKLDSHATVQSTAEEPATVSTVEGSLPVAAADENGVTRSVAGSYKSTMGVMDRFSCFCFNGGYITTASGERIPVCFEGNIKPVTCKNIEVKGTYKTKEIKDEGACTAGSIKYIAAESHTCR